MSNRLQYESSPYLLQHKDNPVEWYPWCEEVFLRAKKEDKPVFLSIGYSTCHWCHVMAHESFEDMETAEILNRYFICIKVDKEERPDIDNVYMSVCQAFTGSGGWPTSIFMTGDQKPFFAGTYFPKISQYGMTGFKDLLLAIHHIWSTDREALLKQSDKIIEHLNAQNNTISPYDPNICEVAVEIFKRTYDETYSGFGRAPKFPSPHNFLFLLNYYEHRQDTECLKISEHTLLQMYRGGIFDHIGFGFCRYSTDKKFLIPHFEKMLYDNALLIIAYCKAYETTKKTIYLEIAEKTASFVLKEMTAQEGGFYSALDADSEGEEGKYYTFTPEEIISVLGKDKGTAFNRHFGITEKGNFEGKNIPNLLNSDYSDKSFDDYLSVLEEYRKKRFSLHLDDKILTFWNSLMIGAMCRLYLVSKNDVYLNASEKADKFISEKLSENGTLFVSYRDGKRGVEGFLDDYAGYIFAQLELYRATLNPTYFEKAETLCNTLKENFEDKSGGFYLYGNTSEALIARPKETYDGAIPSGNSLMAYNLVRLWLLTTDEKHRKSAEQQLDFLSADASTYPAGYAMFLTALLEYTEPIKKVTVVGNGNTNVKELPFLFDSNTALKYLSEPTEEYPLKNNKTTYYVCKSNSCLRPVNNLGDLS